MTKIIIFTDLDGTLLDHKTYSFAKARKALELVRETKTPLVICTSKTRAEIEFYRKKLGIYDPFISENGGGIFIPINYFSNVTLNSFQGLRSRNKFGMTKEEFEMTRQGVSFKKINKYYVIQLGTDYKSLRKVIMEIIKQGIKITGFYDMTNKELSKDSGLSLAQAKKARKREYDEPFKLIAELFPGAGDNRGRDLVNSPDGSHGAGADKRGIRNFEKRVISIIKKNGLNYTKGGRYYHLMGDNDKGKAVKLLTALYKKQFGKVKTIGLGDSENDFSMLNAVDEPYLVKRSNGKYASKKFKKAEGVGPAGWDAVVAKHFQ